MFGGLDGIITTFAIVSAAVGAGLGNKTVIVMGLANLVADAISMGLGDAELLFLTSLLCGKSGLESLDLRSNGRITRDGPTRGHVTI